MNTGILLPHENITPETARVTDETTRTIQFEILLISVERVPNLPGMHPVVLAYIDCLFNRHNTTSLNLVHIDCA
jgi:hypothetical protein